MEVLHTLIVNEIVCAGMANRELMDSNVKESHSAHNKHAMHKNPMSYTKTGHREVATKQ